MKTHLFSHRFITVVSTVFFGFITLLHIVLRMWRHQVYFDMDNYWPISIFFPKLPVWQDSFTLISIGGFWWLFIKLWEEGKSLLLLILTSGLLIINTNLLQGVHDGWTEPVKGSSSGFQYWQDVDKIHGGVFNLLKNYEWLQPTLHMHSRVHPPGPLIFIYFLRTIWNNPLFVGAVMLILALSSTHFLYEILKDDLGEEYARWAAITLLLIPAVQIYSLATIDAVIMALFTATWWAWQKGAGAKRLGLTIILFFLSSFFTFAAVFLLPILVFVDWQRHRHVKQFTLLLIGVIGLYGSLVHFFGFNYVNSFLVAKSFEGTKGFYGFEQPLSYTVTRVENIMEVLVFFGPFLTYLLFVFIKECLLKKADKSLALVSLMAIVSLLGFFLAGAYYTGETARAALYIYPFLMVPIAFMAKKLQLSRKIQIILMSFVFTQTVVMQLLGNYYY